MATVEWTQIKPMFPGLYWYWNSKMGKPTWIEVYEMYGQLYIGNEDLGTEKALWELSDDLWWQPAIVPDPPLRPGTGEAKNG